jgi:serine/threonine protein kinase
VLNSAYASEWDHLVSDLSCFRLIEIVGSAHTLSVLEPGTKLGRYEIRSQLGAGGMGEVYLAQDTRLDRKVALKILPHEVAADPNRMRRFVQEAKAASGLNHPNIITIYEIDQTDSTPFIASDSSKVRLYVNECERSR